ncbi:PEP-CTERM sorting domain-containing protein [Microcystis wesenbergii]|uniref:PEP-CTERM sorting domain-containing protein n=1 Tax=Microcystis wesenbergii NRERC-220 TaxID=3068991 RepID=A0ABU3HNW6_9CHRO|nr:PEP-CTERM sorting domain-containing protein [Microcystis wesenbergii]MDT3676243.1 PEP-CTERM sorting domain-containing protein [Microcystis wesenbergii NRERC-220]
MRSHQVAVLLSTFATVALVAPAVQAATLVTSLPIQFVNVTGGFTSPSTPPGSPDPINGISATINGAGSGSTIPFNPTTGGAILGNFVAANVLFNYTAGDPLTFDLLSNGSSVFTDTFSITGNYNIDLTSVVPGVANTNLVVQFSVLSGTGTTGINGVKLEITTKTPEPGTMTAIGLLGLGLAGAATRRQLQEKAKTKV